jgi:sugar-specific transcriptional regulator TrmB
MTKYKQCYQDMISSNKELFARFKQIHDQYATDQEKWQKEFNEVGEEVQEVIRKYDRILCGHSEAGKYGKFSSNLSEKFKDEIRKEFPHIDFIGTIYT